MYVLRYYGCTDLCIRILRSLVCIICNLLSLLSLVLCCDIYRSTLILIMYPACMITVHDRKSRALLLGQGWEPFWLLESYNIKEIWEFFCNFQSTLIFH